MSTRIVAPVRVDVPARADQRVTAGVGEAADARFSNDGADQVGLAVREQLHGAVAVDVPERGAVAS
ncbi:hypothetical protein [Candidatus Poriferisodalis sp.]|uniref:hypothetical protein n=1 Tax=Candidatus Poriferisodalis sp. TaxID=3101277 RepID=UPI003AF9D061